MSSKRDELMSIVMEMINDSIEWYDKDPHYAPPKWILENWWKTLQIISCLDEQDDEQ